MLGMLNINAFTLVYSRYPHPTSGFVVNTTTFIAINRSGSFSLTSFPHLEGSKSAADVCQCDGTYTRYVAMLPLNAFKLPFSNRGWGCYSGDIFLCEGSYRIGILVHLFFDTLLRPVRRYKNGRVVVVLVFTGRSISI
jgi:hypothetical protein